jgi:beta-lactamase class A
LPTLTPLAVATPTKPPRPATLDEAIAEAINKSKGTLGANAEYGIVIHNLDTGDKVSINGHKNFETASLYKLYVMLATYYDISQGNLSLDSEITLSEIAADEEEDGSLIVPIGDSLPVRDLLDPMITSSNNTAALMLLFQVKLPRFRQIIANLGFTESDLSDSYNFQATPEDLDLYLSRLANQKLLGSNYDKEMLDLMLRQKVRDRIPALLPPNTKIANKTGDLSDVENDAGLVFLPNGQRLAITVMVHNVSDLSAARQFISELSLAAYNFYSNTIN